MKHQEQIVQTELLTCIRDNGDHRDQIDRDLIAPVPGVSQVLADLLLLLRQVVIAFRQLNGDLNWRLRFQDKLLDRLVVVCFVRLHEVDQEHVVLHQLHRVVLLGEQIREDRVVVRGCCIANRYLAVLRFGLWICAAVD